MVDAPLQHQPHQLLGRRGHVLEALPEGDHGEAVVLQRLHHHGRVPAVVGDLADVVALAQLADELLDEAVVDDVALRGLDEALLLPHVVHDVVAPHAQGKRVLRQPEERQHGVYVTSILGRKYQHQRGQVARRGKVEAGIAGFPLQFVGLDHAAALVPLVHGHPAHGLFHPLVQSQLPEHVLVGGRFQRLMVGVAYLVDGDGVPQRWVGLVPVLLILPVSVVRKAKDHGIESRIVLAPFEDVQRLLVDFPADGVAVSARCGEQKPQRLFARVAAALRHDVVEGARGLGVQLVEDTGGHIQAVFGRHLAGEYLIDAPCWLVDHALHGGDDLDALHERRGLFHHVHGHVEYDGRLLAVGGAGVDLRLPFIVIDQHVERDGRAQLAVVRRYHRQPGEILMRRTVHLNAAHLHPVRKRLDVLQVMKTGARFLRALPPAVIFSF